MSQPKPLLLLDIDGVLNPYKCLTKKGFLVPKTRENEEKFTWHRHIMHPTGWEDKELPVLLSQDMAKYFKKLEEVFTIVWATTWRHDANKWISPLVGLGQIPVIDFIEDGTEYDWARLINHRGSWKTKWIAQWLDEFAWYQDNKGQTKRLPWVFVDDEINRDDRAWLKNHWNEQESNLTGYVAPRWLLRIEPSRGLTSIDFQDLYDWGQRQQIAKINSGS